MSYGATSLNVLLAPQPSAAVRKMETTVDKSLVGVDDLYRVAIDPCATQEQLKEAWDATKSTRVRKAVASNPNCDSATMCMAARLYLREVIANPSFELLNLFDEDKFVKRIYDAYSDPQLFYGQRDLLSIRNTGGDRVNTARALLVSPQLRSAKILQDICATLTGAEFSRELKDADVFDNVREVARGNLGYFGLSCLMFLSHHGVIDTPEFGKALSLSSSPSQHYTPKGQYTGFVEKHMSDYPLLYRYLYVNRPSNIRDLVRAVRKDSGLRSDDHLDTYAALYRDFLLHDVMRSRAKSQNSKARYGWVNSRHLGDEDFSHHLSDLIWTTIASKNVPEGADFNDLDLSPIYQDITRVGFDRDFGPYRCEIKFGNVSDTITSRSRMCEKLLGLVDDRAFEFFTTSGVVWDEWYGKSEKGNLESMVVDRLHSINERRFGLGLDLLYHWSDLDSFPTVRVKQRNGLEYEPDRYVCVGAPISLPTPSGRIDRGVISEMAVRGVRS